MTVNYLHLRWLACATRSSGGREWFLLAVLGLSAGLAALLLCVAELGLRTFYPQTLRVVQVDSPTGRRPVPGQPLPPNTRFIVEGPEYSLEYQTDDRGFRTAVTRTGAAETAARRFVVLGDSFTFGSGVAYPDTWPARLQEGLHREGLLVEVINAGLWGYDTRSEVLLLEKLLPTLDPDFVLLVFLPNDLFTNRPLELASTLTTTAFHGTTSRIRTRQDKRSDFDVVTLSKRLLLSFDATYVALYSISARREYFGVPLSNHCRRQLETTEDLLAAAASLCRQAGVPFAVLSLPQQFQVIAEVHGLVPSGVDAGHMDRSLGKFAATQGFEWISAYDAFIEEHRKSGEDLYYRLDGHFNASGHLLVARWLLDRLAKDLRYAL